MTARSMALLAASGSAALLLGALAFQYLGDLPPCKMCIWQRWPHGAAIAIGVVLAVTGTLWLAFAGAIAALMTTAIAAYHVGVEQSWFEGPSTCTSGPIDNVTSDALFDQIMAAPLVRCDEVLWSFLGISMAGWNGVISLCLAVLWLVAFAMSRKSEIRA